MQHQLVKAEQRDLAALQFLIGYTDQARGAVDLITLEEDSVVEAFRSVITTPEHLPSTWGAWDKALRSLVADGMVEFVIGRGPARLFFPTPEGRLFAVRFEGGV